MSTTSDPIGAGRQERSGDLADPNAPVHMLDNIQRKFNEVSREWQHFVQEFESTCDDDRDRIFEDLLHHLLTRTAELGGKLREREGGASAGIPHEPDTDELPGIDPREVDAVVAAPPEHAAPPPAEQDRRGHLEEKLDQLITLFNAHVANKQLPVGGAAASLPPDLVSRIAREVVAKIRDSGALSTAPSHPPADSGEDAAAKEPARISLDDIASIIDHVTRQ
jgi:hypothetical protein